MPHLEEYDPPFLRTNETLWTTANNGRIVLPNMSTQHLKSSIAKCYRCDWRLDWLPKLEQELSNRTYRT